MGTLYHLGQKFIDFCKSVNQIEDNALSVPTSHVVYGINEYLTYSKTQTLTNASAGSATFYRKGNVVTFSYSSGNTVVPSGNTVLGTLDSDLQPPANLVFEGFPNATTGAFFYVAIGTNREVTIRHSSGGNWISCSGTYVVV